MIERATRINLQIREKKEKEMEVLNNYMESASVLRICWCTGFRKATPTAVVTFSFFLSLSSSSSHLTLKARQKKMEQCCLKVLPLYVRLFSSFSFFSLYNNMFLFGDFYHCLRPFNFNGLKYFPPNKKKIVIKI